MGRKRVSSLLNGTLYVFVLYTPLLYMGFHNITYNISLRVLLITFGIIFTTNSLAKGNNTGKNWEVSFGMESLSFFYNNEREFNHDSDNEFFSKRRTSLGASVTIGKWISPEFLIRTKANGYWGKSLYTGDPANNAIRYWSAQEYLLLDIIDCINGNSNAKKFYTVMPAVGIGFARNCTYNSNSLSLAFGINNRFRISDHFALHAEIGLNLEGNQNQYHPSETNRYKLMRGEVGLTFNLGNIFAKRKDHRKLYNSGSTDYRDILFSNHETDSLGRILIKTYNPEGMTLINRGHIKMGIEDSDYLWGKSTPIRDVSVDDFWIDKTEVTNKMYRAFVQDIIDSIVYQRLDDPYYMGDIEKVRESLYITNPITREKHIDTNLLNYVYEIYDYKEAAKRINRFNANERNLNTDIAVNPDEVVLISKDTAYIDNKGNIISETITRPLSSYYDFLNTYIVNICPDTTVWVNDFPQSDNLIYMRYYYSHPAYDDYPVVGVTWEQANAYCAWRTEKLKNQLGGSLGDEQPYRLPTEAEWEYAARGKSQNEFPWENHLSGEGRQLLFANFQPDDGDYTKDGNIITSKVGIFPPNSNGLFDMAGNVAEWTSTAYTDAGVEAMNNINPENQYNAAYDDPYRMKKKTVRGGSWKDSESHIKAAWRTSEYQNQPRSYIGFRCVRSIAAKPSERTVILKK